MGRHSGLQEGQHAVRTLRLSAFVCRLILGTVILTSLCAQSEAQDFLNRGGALPAGGDGCDVSDPIPCLKRIAQDEAGITKSIFHIKRSSLPALIGIAAATGVSLHFDKQMSQALTSLPVHPKPWGQEADIAGVYGPLGIGGFLYVTGSFVHNSRVRETGLLATEAMIDAALMGKALKYVTNRQAPGSGPESFNFYASGLPRGGSMPSSHALNAWSFARVIAGESHSKWISVLAYSVATSVSFSRALTGAHSVSDLIVGSAMGYGIGEYVLRRRSYDRDVPIRHISPNQADVAAILRREELRQPEGPLKTAAPVKPEEVLAQMDEPQSSLSDQSTVGDIDPGDDSPS